MPVSEKFPVRTLMLTTGLATATLIVVTMFLATGEVVRLTTLDASGQPLATELWIADLPDGSYLRAGDSKVKWLERLSSGATASLERNGDNLSIETIVVQDPDKRVAVQRAMAEKYGLADRMWSMIRSDDSVVIRIHSLGAATASVHLGPRGVPTDAQATP